MPYQPETPEAEQSSYAGRWIARLGRRIIGQGGTPEQALWAAKGSRFKEIPQIEYIPTMQPLMFSERLEHVRAIIPPDLEIYLVGGAVRDALLHRTTHDLDFALAGDALKVGRQVADALGAAFYPLDDERNIARVLVRAPDGTQDVMDFNQMRGPDLESDLHLRDFTVNAMAVDLRNPQALLDPMGGAADLFAKKLRACNSSAFRDDPVRILRSVRLAVAFDLHIQRESLQEMKQVLEGLEDVSVERLRDELFRILAGPQPATAVQALEKIGVFEYFLPELGSLKGVTQSAPHIADVWSHTIDALRKLESLLSLLEQDYDPDKSSTLWMGLATLRLGRYREQISAHLRTVFVPDRTLRPLLFFAVLYHDIGKPQTRFVDEHGRVRFFNHDSLGATVVQTRASALHLSAEEIARLTTIVRHHLRPVLLSQSGQPPSRKAIYRFFRHTGAAGVDICLLSLADVMATWGSGLPQDVWVQHLDTVRALLEAWWEHPQESVSPPALLNGNELMKELNILPGRHIGEILESIQEGQATGQINSREEALALARALLDSQKVDYG